MIVLALESTAKAASAAVLSDDRVLAQTTVYAGRTHSETLLPMTDALLADCGLGYDDIDLFACAAGPGSFTGVRIGAATVKGLAFGRQKPCAEVSATEALAENLVPLSGILCPVMDARRDQVYNALFTVRDGTLVRLCEDRAISAAALAGEITEKYPHQPIRLVGDGIAVAEDALRKAGADVCLPPAGVSLQSAASVGVCALRAFYEGKTVSDAAFRPAYLRLPQAERERLERLQKENKTE